MEPLDEIQELLKEQSRIGKAQLIVLDKILFEIQNERSQQMRREKEMRERRSFFEKLKKRFGLD